MEIVWQTPANPPQPEDYIFRNGRRHVRPYYFEFISHTKNRWAGKTIVDLFAQEFKGRPRDYYISAVKSGRIQVDGQRVHVSYILQPSQKISHFLHRHEPPVMASDVLILRKEPDVLTVCKPASVPVHPCGQYRKNTVVGILQAEHGLTPLFHRLVSGLLILARNPTKADLFRQQIEAGEVQKEYIAQVVGVFPEEELVVNANLIYNAREGRSSVEADEPDSNRSLKGKTACTKFTRISTNGTYSVVLCKPITGRTHQLLLIGLQKEQGLIVLQSLMQLSILWHLVFLTRIIPPKLKKHMQVMTSALILCVLTAQIWLLKDMKVMRKRYGCIAYDTLGLVGVMNAHIRIGHFLVDSVPARLGPLILFSPHMLTLRKIQAIYDMGDCMMCLAKITGVSGHELAPRH